MDRESLHTKAETYRATAERMRRLAVRLRFSEARIELLGLADRFDRLAARVGGARGEPAQQPAAHRAASGRAA